MPPTCKRSTTHRKVRDLKATRCLAPFSTFCHMLKSIWNAYVVSCQGDSTLSKGCSRSFCEVEQHSSSSTERTPLSYFAIALRFSMHRYCCWYLLREIHTHAIDETCSAAAELKPPGHIHSRLGRLDDSIKTGP